MSPCTRSSTGHAPPSTFFSRAQTNNKHHQPLCPWSPGSTPLAKNLPFQQPMYAWIWPFCFPAVVLTDLLQICECIFGRLPRGSTRYMPHFNVQCSACVGPIDCCGSNGSGALHTSSPCTHSVCNVVILYTTTYVRGQVLHCKARQADATVTAASCHRQQMLSKNHIDPRGVAGGQVGRWAGWV